MLACGTKSLLLYKQLVTLERNVDIEKSLYDRTKPNLFTINEDKKLVLEKPLLSVEKLALTVDEADPPFDSEENEATEQSDFSTSRIRFVGERSPLAADVLVEISDSLGTPLDLLRQMYNRLDRVE